MSSKSVSERTPRAVAGSSAARARTGARLRRAGLFAVAALVLVPLAPVPAHAVTGTQPWAIVLCNFSNHTATPNSIGYYERMFSDAGVGELNVLEYWRDVSYGNVSVSGSVVTGWHTVPQTRDQWMALNRYDKIEVCSDKAAQDGFNFSPYYGVVVIFPEAVSNTTAAIDASQTTVGVQSVASFPPAAPFLIVIDDGTSANSEIVRVTGISGNTFTIQRAQNGTTAKPHNSGAVAIAPGDFGNWGPGRVGMNLDGTNFSLGMVIGPDHYNLTGVVHEMGHGFGYGHTRRLSTSTTDYGDCYDIMSAFSCVYTFQAGTNFGGSNLGSAVAAKGPGVSAPFLDLQGWLAGARIRTFDNSSCSQATIPMAALNRSSASGAMEVRLPASVTIPTPGSTTTTSDYYTVELRSKSGWDRGIPRDAFVLHLKGQDNVAYWVDDAGGNGEMLPGEEFVNAAESTYVAANSIDGPAGTGVVTVAGCKINTVLTYVGSTGGDYSDDVTLAADLKVAGSSAPVPGAPVALGVGSDTCTGTTNASGRASCTVRLTRTPGTTSVAASYAGEPAYNGASTTAPFVVDREDTTLTYTGATTSDYNDAFTAGADLRDADGSSIVSGRSVGFSLGGVDTCTGTTSSSGAAACSLTPSQPAGTSSIAVSFAGDSFYKPSSTSAPFEITHQETTTTYIGPTVIADGVPVSLRGRLLEEGVAPISGQRLMLALGTQTCLTGFTDAAGEASCTITPAVSALGPVPLSATFAGNQYYEPSADTSATAVVFAFPSHGAFVLGDTSVASAGPTTSLTWWGEDWYLRNTLSGGQAPASFKGFARQPSSTPPACGGTWVTAPGNSPPPPASVPSYMGTVVASEVGAAGSRISGDVVKIVVVRTAAGYAPSPANAGRGTIVATYCG